MKPRQQHIFQHGYKATFISNILFILGSMCLLTYTLFFVNFLKFKTQHPCDVGEKEQKKV